MISTIGPRRYDLIVFDWDGTLFDSTALIAQCIQAACEDLGLPRPSDADAAHVIGLGLHDALAHVAPSLPAQRYPELGACYRRHYMARQDELSLFPGTLDMLDRLRSRSCKLAVATGKSRRGLDAALSHVSLRGLFDATRTADETAPKPDPRMLHELMVQAAVPAERTLMIGDTTHDLMLASNAGVSGLAVAFGAHPLEVLQAHEPVHVAATPAELHRWLDTHA